MADFFARKRRQLVYLFVCLLLVLTAAVFFLAANLQLLEEKVVAAAGAEPAGAAVLPDPADVSLKVMSRLAWLIRAGIVTLMGLGAVILGNILELIVRMKALETGDSLHLNYRQARRPHRSC